MTVEKRQKSDGLSEETLSVAAEKSKSRAKSKAAYHHGDLRKALVEAGIEIVENDGVQALSLRGVARRAGVSQTAPYHHFADKEALLAAIAETGFRDLADAMDADVTARRPAPAALPAAHRVQALGFGYVHFAVGHPGRFRLMFGPMIDCKENYPSLLQASMRSYDMIQTAVAARLTEIGTPYPNLEASTMTAWALVHGLATLLIDGRFETGQMDKDAVDGLITHATRALQYGLGREVVHP